MFVLFYAVKVPMRRKVLSPFFFCDNGTFFLLFCRLRCISQLLKEKDKFIIHLQNAVSWIWETAHNCTATRGVHGGGFLPYNRSHIVHTERLAKTNNLRSNRDYFIPTIVYRASKLIAYVDTHSASVGQYTIAFLPHQI